jgi:Asp-tRNA(Asn)/Glu-tRNA(Gln) amidotransferase A subunit family amidase
LLKLLTLRGGKGQGPLCIRHTITIADTEVPIQLFAGHYTSASLGAAFWRILATEAAAYHREALELRPETFDPKTREFLEKGLTTPATKYLDACKVQREFRRDIVAVLRRYDAILVPSTPAPAPEGLDSTGDPLFNNPWSMTGNPVVGLPSGLSAARLPMAVQVVGPAFAEASLLALARWCESVLGFNERPAMVAA